MHEGSFLKEKRSQTLLRHLGGSWYFETFNAEGEQEGIQRTYGNDGNDGGYEEYNRSAGKNHGHCLFVFANGLEAEGEYERGEQIGTWKITDEDGS